MVDIDPKTGAPIVAPATPTSDFTPPTDVKPTDAPKTIVTTPEAKVEMKHESPASLKSAITNARAKSEKELLADEVADIQKEYGGMESNIPLHHPYWDKCNQLRGMK